MLDQIRARIEAEIERLTHELTVALPKAIKIAVEHGDLRERRLQVRPRATAVRAGPDQPLDPADGGTLQDRSEVDAHDRVGFGSSVKVLNLSVQEEESFTIVAGDFMDLDAGQVSLASPIGRGLLGAREGEEVVVRLPIGERRFRVLELRTLPMQLGMAGE